ncbi:MAG: hypothetical protein QOF60_2196 [Actinomycetota bacterium]|jgi:diguanylate cyclase (GGDEF)-like protein|nr:hypothetical protein [Actinomycetota bacterium]
MLPLTAMLALTLSVVGSHRSAATEADAVAHGVARLSELVALDNALHAQQSVAAFDARFVPLGVTRDAASTFLGFDLGAEVGPARARAAAAITSLGAASPVSVASLQAFYDQVDSAAITAAAAYDRLDLVIVDVEAAFVRGLDLLAERVGDAGLFAALESLRATTGLVDIAMPQVLDLSAIWFPAPDDTAQTAAAALGRLGGHRAGYTAAVVELKELGVPSVVASVKRIEADPEVQKFQLAVGATLLGEPLAKVGGKVDSTYVAETFRGFFALNAMVDDLVTTTATGVRDEALRVAAAERAGFVDWAGAAAALAVASIAVALWLARSISRPLKGLARYAQAINEGRLDAVPFPRRKHGPRETRLAFRVFTDLVTNLQLLDAKANALAQCDFDDPVLSQPLPGRLGLSLESSVAVLSGSIVERDRLQTHLAHQATHDSLTGINNRPAAISAIEAAMHRSERTGATIGLLYVDLNEFKAVNDRHGHEGGDEVLREVASRVKATLRGGDLVARLGGDEFVIVAEGITDVADATDLGRRVIEAIGEPIAVGALSVTIGAAVGVALNLDGPEEPLRLLARADAAMYRAKHHGGSAIEIFDADLQHQMVERAEIESALTTALADPSGGGLRLHYQPVLDAASAKLVGVEALIRWDRPGHGLLPPDSFIPVAEASALIVELDRWVLDEATRQLVEWSAVPELAGVPVAVNISGRHLLSRTLADHIGDALDRSGVHPSRLTIEITETVLLADLVVAASELDLVRALGVHVAIDDFGTGYTSLAHLQQLPIDTIKIDRCFISQLNARRGNALVRLVTDLGHAIDINIVAEGVETRQELAALQAMGADHIQGYLLSRPLEPAALVLWEQTRASAARQEPVPAT